MKRFIKFLSCCLIFLLLFCCIFSLVIFLFYGEIKKFLTPLFETYEVDRNNVRLERRINMFR